MSENDVTSLEERYEPDSAEESHESQHTCSYQATTCLCVPSPE